MSNPIRKKDTREPTTNGGHFAGKSNSRHEAALTAIPNIDSVTGRVRDLLPSNHPYRDHAILKQAIETLAMQRLELASQDDETIAREIVHAIGAADAAKSKGKAA